jgi:hypothetical protein
VSQSNLMTRDGFGIINVVVDVVDDDDDDDDK